MTDQQRLYQLPPLTLGQVLLIGNALSLASAALDRNMPAAKLSLLAVERAMAIAGVAKANELQDIMEKLCGGEDGVLVVDMSENT